MIYALLFYEFCKIGLLAVGGGLVTVPFLFDLSENYGWFTTRELVDMIAISESTPGPIGVNMATFVGFNTAGVGGALAAVIGLVLPSVVTIIGVAKLMNRYQCNMRVQTMLKGVRPAVVALMIAAGMSIAELALTDMLCGLVFAFLLAAVRMWRHSPIFYLAVAAVIGVALKL